MHARIHPRLPAWVTLIALLAGCLDPNGGPQSPLVTTSDGTSSATTGATTFPEILTTTFEPDDSGSGDPIPLTCGNGKIDPGELCDEGEANDNSARCTLACQWNVCGDGHLFEGKEACDDGEYNGFYGHCDQNCDGLHKRCGDRKVQKQHGEQCDDPAPYYGCLKNCAFSTSCKAILQSWGDEADTGLYVIRRGGAWTIVWCDMEADGGGYTFLKYASGTYDYDKPADPFNEAPLTAAEAEQRCAAMGMRLFAPRSPEHLEAAIKAADTKYFGPINKGVEFPPSSAINSDVRGYLKIMAIYPVTPGQSCVGKPLNSVDCPEWTLRPDPMHPDKILPWYVTDKIIMGQPTTQNCANCSMYYNWGVDPARLLSYDAYQLAGQGPRSAHFLCEIGDKHGPDQ